MARTSSYLNFPRHTEEVFNFYRTVFGGTFLGNGIVRYKDMPKTEGMPPLLKDDENLILHIELEITGGHILMGSDAPESMGFRIQFGNHVFINLEPDTREEAKRLFTALAAGGTVIMDMQDMFWGAYYGCCKDKYNVNWMINCTEPIRQHN